ncbi:MAG TPA: hypothetical protein VNN80_32235, partial [Polyangiaceae bacterium]|nr:hypothetical protein [Polyangiaceae bacterium]
MSPICLGWVGHPSVIPAAYDAGINFFFLTSDMHWPLYEATRRGLADLLRRSPAIRDRVVVGVTSYVQEPDFCHMPFREVIAAVPGLGRIDVTILGSAHSREFLLRLPEYHAHRLDGEHPTSVRGVRATGATFHDRGAGLLAVNHGLVDVAFARYNPDHPGAEQDLFPHLQKRPGTLLYNFNSTRGHVKDERLLELGLTRRHWRPKVADHYRFVLRRPEIDGVLCGLASTEELETLHAALAAGGLD